MKIFDVICKKKNYKLWVIFLFDFVLINWVRLSVYIYLKNIVRFGLVLLGMRGYIYRYS